MGVTVSEGQQDLPTKDGNTEVLVHTFKTATEALEAYTRLIDPIRAIAKQLGYAIGVHGSLKRDIDLIAVPWADHAVAPELLAQGIINVVKFSNKNHWVHVNPSRSTDKPHGRLCWSIFVTGSVYIDLSVMPRSVPAEQPKVRVKRRLNLISK